MRRRRIALILLVMGMALAVCVSGYLGRDSALTGEDKAPFARHLGSEIQTTEAEFPTGPGAPAESRAKSPKRPSPSFGLEEQVEVAVRRHVAELKNGENLTLELDRFAAERPDVVIEVLVPRLRDDSAIVRRRLVALLAYAGSRSRLPANRAIAVEALVDLLEDPESMVARATGEYLLWFEPKDFSGAVRQQLTELLEEPEPSFEVIKLAGYVAVRDESERLLEISSIDVNPGLREGPRYYRTARWAATLSLARTGDSASLRQALKRVQSEEDQNLRITRLLDDVGFIGNEEAFDLVRLYLESEEKLPPVKGEWDRVPHAQHALHVLARWLPGFPVREAASPLAYTTAELERARAWMAVRQNWANARPGRSRDTANG